MTKLEELIQELCPDGVEYKKLSLLAEIGTGNSDRKNATEDGLYPFYVRSKEILRSDDYEYDEEAIIIPGEGGIGEIFHLANGKYALHQRAYRIHLITTELTSKFLYYYMVSNFKAFIMQKAVSATVTSIRKPMIEQFPLPVPPLPVQREIVRILDKFTELTAELTAELAARNRQYEYYKSCLLSFNTDTPKYRLTDIFDTRNGYTPSKSNKEFWSVNDIPWFRMEDIRENGRILNKAIQGASKSAVKGNPFPTNSIIVSTSATIGEHALIRCEFLANQRFTCLMLKNDYKGKYSIMFLYYYCFVLDEFCKNNLNQGNFASVDMRKFNDFEFPMPPLEEQERIVAILDRFDKLCNDITIGLPAEIEARQKQYEYYRDKLLTFKEKTS